MELSRKTRNRGRDMVWYWLVVAGACLVILSAASEVDAAAEPVKFLKKYWELIVGVLALAGGVWAYARRAMYWLASIFIVTVDVNQTAATAVVTYLCRLPRNRWHKGPYYVQDLPIAALRKHQKVVFYSVAGGARPYFDGWKPVWIRLRTVASQDADETPNTFVRVSWLRFFLNWEGLLHRAAEYINSNELQDTSNVSITSERFKVHLHEGGNSQEITKTHEKANEKVEWSSRSTFQLIGRLPSEIGTWFGSSYTLALTPEIQSVADEFRRWTKKKAWYQDRGMTWKRGWLAYGPPGSGKTSLIRAEARLANMPVHILDIGSMTNHNLRTAWARVKATAPCVAVFEDIDAVFHGRENIGADEHTRDALTFDALLQVLDGVDQADGIAVWATTNKVEHVDDALKRPGRFDRHVEFKALGLEQRVCIAERILGPGTFATAFAMSTGEQTGAVFQELCCLEATRLEFAEAAAQQDQDETAREHAQLKREVACEHPIVLVDEEYEDDDEDEDDGDNDAPALGA